jgi:DNA repair exonuclease SbcCD nuclease subunit
MKLIHTADLHLGSKIESKFPASKSKQRRAELRDSFSRLIERAKELGAEAILIAGDAFDTAPATPEDFAFFFDAVRANPDLVFLLLHGNHDAGVPFPKNIPNLVTFGDAWTVWEKDGVAVSGIEMTRGNCASLYDSFSPVPGKVNIVTLHGGIGSSPAVGTVVLSRLADRGIDYLALGDYHGLKQDKLGTQGTWAYPGCPEGRGFDEPGEKGFLLLTIENGTVKTDFIPHASRTLRVIDCDVSAASGEYEAIEMARDLISSVDPKDPIRLNLIGAVSFDRTDLAHNAETRLNDERKHYFVSVKDKTHVALDLEEIKREVSLRGEFLNLLDQNGDLSDEDKSAILELGLRALTGQDLT